MYGEVTIIMRARLLILGWTIIASHEIWLMVSVVVDAMRRQRWREGGDDIFLSVIFLILSPDYEVEA
jgi:hypothetical protein